MSLRLDILLDHVRGRVIADIGCDHAILATAAVVTGRAEKAYACDIAEGPLSRARETIEKEGMTGSVIPLLSDGLNGLPETCDQIIIAGMGADTIIHILQEGRDKIGPNTNLLLSPHTKAPLLRTWLLDNEYVILSEQFIEERDRFYPVMEVYRAEQGRPIRSMSIADLEFGIRPVMDSACIHFLNAEKRRLEDLAARVPAPRAAEIEQLLQALKARLQKTEQS